MIAPRWFRGALSFMIGLSLALIMWRTLPPMYVWVGPGQVVTVGERR